MVPAIYDTPSVVMKHSVVWVSSRGTFSTDNTIVKGRQSHLFIRRVGLTKGSRTMQGPLYCQGVSMATTSDLHTKNMKYLVIKI